MNIAIIPARGGSKRIPRKNIKHFFGRPMIAWSIELALQSRCIDKVVVSTDDAEIAEIAINSGAEVPFIRPKELSCDSTPTVPVIAHSIGELLKMDWKIEYICCIYPCTPLITSTEIESVYSEFITTDSHFAYPVVEYTHPVQRAMKMLGTKKMEFCYPEYELTPTQELEKLFHDSGQFYWGTLSAWHDEKRMHTDGIGVEIDSWKVVDIDNHDDWQKAELMKKVLSL
jgi:pseudaminic acid cytidylyltransferase